MATVPSSTAKISCLCRSIDEPGTIFEHPTLPLPLELCHCDSCRHSSGAMAGTFVNLRGRPSQASLDQCVEFASSGAVSRYFCRTCGSKMFVRVGDLWFVWAACVERPEGPASEGDDSSVDTVEIAVQAFINDTKDGGLFGRIVDVAKEEGQTDSKLFKTVYPDGFSGPTLSMNEITDLVNDMKAAASNASSSDKLLAKCRCGTIQYYITRPDPGRKYSEEITTYVMAGKDRWQALPCFCRSCRISTGSPVHLWTYIPTEHTFTMDGKPVDFVSNGAKAPNLAGLRQYKSSEKVTWSFCGTCGATVFYEADDRSAYVDLAAGLLRSSRGAMAEDFVTWLWDREEFSLRNECTSRGLMEAVCGKNVKKE